MSEKAGVSASLVNTVLRKDAKRMAGGVARRYNIRVAGIVSELVRTTLGPKGMDKVITKKNGEIVVTNDGATILKTVKLEHPVAKIMTEAAEAQDNVVGDGTTTVVVLAAEYLSRAEKLLEEGIHTTMILKGYSKAAKMAHDILEDIAIPVNPEDDETLRKVALTAMNSKIVAHACVGAHDKLAEIAVKAVKQIVKEINGRAKVDLDSVKIFKQEGGSLEESFIVEGFIIEDREIVRPDMPEYIKNASIALIRGLEFKEITGKEEPRKTSILRIKSRGQYQAFLNKRMKIFKEMVEKIQKEGANVVLINKGIDKPVEHYLTKAGILAVKRIFWPDIVKIAELTGATIVQKPGDLTSAQLGKAEIVRELKIGGERYLVIQGCKGGGAASIMLRGGSKHICEEAERAINDALYAIKNAIEDKKIVVGGGAAEMEIAHRLKTFANLQFAGREQMAVQAFSKAMEIIPKTLAENAGIDVISILAMLRKRHGDGEVEAGVDVLGKSVRNMHELGIYDPLSVKAHAVTIAADVATAILRVDVLMERKRIKGEKPPVTEEEHEKREKKLWEDLLKAYAPTKLSKRLGTTEESSEGRIP